MESILPRAKIMDEAVEQREDSLAAHVLTFLAADQNRLASFLDATGFDPATLRTSATDPSFVDGILDYVMSDDALMVAFAAHLGRSPAIVSAELHRRTQPGDEG